MFNCRAYWNHNTIRMEKRYLDAYLVMFLVQFYAIGNVNSIIDETVVTFSNKETWVMRGFLTKIKVTQLITAAFGRPVVPDVNCILQGSSGWIIFDVFCRSLMSAFEANDITSSILTVPLVSEFCYFLWIINIFIKMKLTVDLCQNPW